MKTCSKCETEYEETRANFYYQKDRRAKSPAAPSDRHRHRMPDAKQTTCRHAAAVVGIASRSRCVVRGRRMKAIALAAAILIGWTVFGLIVGLIVGPFLRDMDE